MQVVAPVRETCAQTIGVILKHTDAESVKRVMMVLLTLQAQEEWEVRHGGLMGLKYLMAVRQVRTVNYFLQNEPVCQPRDQNNNRLTGIIMSGQNSDLTGQK